MKTNLEYLMALRDNLNQELAPYGTVVGIREVYQDFGKGIKGPALVAYDLTGKEWQALTPRQLEEAAAGKNLIRIQRSVVDFVKDSNRRRADMLMWQLENADGNAVAVPVLD